MAADEDGKVTHFCLTDSASGETVCTEGLMYDACLDQDGGRSEECRVPSRRYYQIRSLFQSR